MIPGAQSYFLPYIAGTWYALLPYTIYTHPTRTVSIANLGPSAFRERWASVPLMKGAHLRVDRRVKVLCVSHTQVVKLLFYVLNLYGLVQAKRPKLCQPRMAPAIATRMARIFSIMLTATNSGRG